MQTIVPFAGVRVPQSPAMKFRTGLVVGFAIVYTGHHYVVDALVGAAYAVVVYVAVLWGEKLLRQREAVRDDVESGGPARA